MNVMDFSNDCIFSNESTNAGFVDSCSKVTTSAFGGIGALFSSSKEEEDEDSEELSDLGTNSYKKQPEELSLFGSAKKKGDPIRRLPRKKSKKEIKLKSVTLDWLIRQQKFSGNFSFSIDTLEIVHHFENGIAKLKSAGVVDREILATLIAIVLLHKNFAAQKDEWTLLEAKAKQWVSGKITMKLEDALSLLQ